MLGNKLSYLLYHLLVICYTIVANQKEKYGEYSKHNPELDWVPVGHCRKADFIDPTTSSVTHKVVCKQSDGSWKLDNDRWAGRYGGAFLK